MKRAAPAARFAAELLGSYFVVVTIGCNLHTGSIGAALSVGCIVMAMVMALCPISGAHFNPAITAAVWLSGRGGLGALEALVYVLFQVCGSILGALTCFAVVGKELRQKPMFSYGTHEVVAVEAIYAWALCYVFLNVIVTDTRGREVGYSRPVNGMPVGFTVTAAMIAIGPISGCSLNPAVTVGTQLVYWYFTGDARLAHTSPLSLAPFVGSLLAAISFFLVRGGLRGLYLEDREDWSREAASSYLKQDYLRQEHSPLISRLVRMQAEDYGPPPSSRLLAKQEPLTLPEAIGAHNLFCGLRWRMKRHAGAPETCDVDLSCVKFSKFGECLGAVYFNAKDDAENRIYHSSEEVTGQAGLVDNELITFRLANIRPNVHALVFTMTIYSSGESFDDIEQAYLRLVDLSDENKEICRYARGVMVPGCNALIAAMLHRKEEDSNTWCFKAVDEVCQLPPNSSYRKLIPHITELFESTPGSLFAEAMP